MPDTAGAITVLCADDHPLVREGIESMIGRQPDMTLVASAATSEEAVELFHRHTPDVTLMDLQMPVAGGLEAIRLIRAESPDARIVVLTTYEGDEHIFRALRAGAATYLLKDTLSADLVRIVREVHAGRQVMPPNVVKLLEDREHQGTLTAREAEVVALIAKGSRNVDIARELKITEETVKAHVRNILTKLHVTDRSAAVTVAVRRGIIRV